MALSALTQWEVRTSGASTNGGGFVAGASGTDHSQQDAAQYSVTDGVTNGTTTITSATANFGTDVVGNIMYVAGGTGSVAADWYEITARGSATSITVDRSTGLTAGTGVTLKIGGAISTLTVVETEAVAGNTIHVKSGTYAETLTIATSGGVGTPRRWIGYGTTREDRPSGTDRPLIDGGGVRANCVAFANLVGNWMSYFRMTGSTGATIEGTNGRIRIDNCRIYAAGAEGIKVTTTTMLSVVDTEIDSCTTSGVTSTTGAMSIDGCYIHDNTGNGILVTSAAGITVTNSIVETNGATGIAWTGGGLGALVRNCTIYGNTGASSDGIGCTGNSADALAVRSSALVSNGRYGLFRNTASVMTLISDRNGLYNNGTAAYNNVTAGVGDVTTDPGFTNAAAGDFSIGTNWKALGYPGAFPGGLSTGFMDIGAVQREEAASGGGMLRHPGMTGGLNG